jgi:hypothetical protein
MRLRLTWLVVAGLGLTWPTVAGAQAPPPTVGFDLQVTTAGGFLGYRDGLAGEKPPAGGLISFARWRKEQQRDDIAKGVHDLLLITGNNVPITGGAAAVWTSIGEWHPDAVAVSIDDFLRALLDRTAVPSFVRAINSGTAPLLASNAIIRIRKKGMNRVSDHGFTVDLPRDQSVDWLNKVTVRGGACRDFTATLDDRPMALKCEDAGTRRVRLSFVPTLRPGHTYRLTLEPATRQRRGATLQFSTHRPLIPLGPRLGPDAAPEDLVGLPVRVAFRDVRPYGPGGMPRARIIIVGLVDPATKKRLGADHWRWRNADGPCDGDECELDLADPADTLRMIAELTRRPANQPESMDDVFILMSGLVDRQNGDVLSALPSAREASKEAIAVPVVLLDPDSSSLADGDVSVVTHHEPATRGGSGPTRLWARPPWNAQYADILQARLTWRPVPADGNVSAWLLEAPVASSVTIPAPQTTAVVSGSRVTYTLGTNGTELGTFDRYDTYAGLPLDEEATRRSLAAVVLDVMRRDAHADVAVLPKHFIDADIVAWLALATAGKEGRVDWLSRYVLEKVFYRAENIVTFNIEGKSLSSTLQNLVKSRSTLENEEVFTAGLGRTDAVSKLDTTMLLVNQRLIVDDHVYKVAIPQSVAESQGLTVVQKAAVPSLVDAVDSYLRNVDRQLLRPDGETIRLEQRQSRKTQLYLSLSPATLSYSRIAPTDQDLLSRIPLAGVSAKDQSKWDVSGKGDLALDAPRWAVRLLGDARFTADTFTASPSISADEWTVGGRGDVKLKSGQWRAFAGVFRQSRFREPQVPAVTPTRTVSGLVAVTTGEQLAFAKVSGETVSLVTDDPNNPDKPIYTFFRLGGEMPLYSWSGLSLTNGSVSFDTGRADNDRTNLIVMGFNPIPVDKLYQQGMESVVNQLFEAHPEAFAVPQQVAFAHAGRRTQRRWQVDLSGQLKPSPPWTRWTRVASITGSTLWRYYYDADGRPSYTANNSQLWKLQIQMRLFSDRATLGPSAEFYRVAIKAPPDVAVKPLNYLKWGIELNMPLFVSARPARILN